MTLTITTAGAFGMKPGDRLHIAGGRSGDRRYRGKWRVMATYGSAADVEHMRNLRPSRGFARHLRRRKAAERRAAWRSQ